MTDIFGKPFKVVTDGSRYFVIAQVDETTATRATALLREGDETLAQLVADALNLRAVAGLIQKEFVT